MWSAINVFKYPKSIGCDVRAVVGREFMQLMLGNAADFEEKCLELSFSEMVGTEIAHAVPLTLVAGLGHAGMGNMDWHLLGFLLMGSLPGIYFGSHMTGKIPDGVLRPCLAIMLMAVGYKLAF